MLDKYEYRVRTEQMLEYYEKKSFVKAMEIADTIDWKKVKNASMLSTVSEIYENCGAFQKSRDVLFVAYDKAPGSRKVVYRLGTLAIKINDIGEATDCYEEFVTLAPKDPNQYILRYKILKAQKAPLEQQIEALEDFKKAEYVEKWAYELALLYYQAGMTAECLEECDDLILWFSEGKYVYQAMELKMKFKPLTPLQQEKFNHRHDPKLNKPVFRKENTKPEGKTNIDSPTDDMREIMLEEDEELMVKESEPIFQSAITKTVVGATLEEALVSGVALANGKVLDEETQTMETPMKDETEAVVENQISDQMGIEDILQGWEEKQKEAQNRNQYQEEIDSTEEEQKDGDIEDIVANFSMEAQPEESVEIEAEPVPEEVVEIEEEIAPEEDFEIEEEAVSEEEEEDFEIEEESASEEDFEIDEDFESDESFDIEDFEVEEEFEDFDEDEFDMEGTDFEEAEELEEKEAEEDEESGDDEKEVDLQDLLEEGQKPSKPGPYDTGFVVQGRYDLSATSEIGLKAGLTEEQKKLFSYFVPVRGMSEQIVEVLAADKACKKRYGTSGVGNLLVIGRKGSGKTVLAVDIVKAIQKLRKLKQAKVAIVTGDALNKKELDGVISKLYGGAIIIEKAAKLNSRTIKELNELMEGQTGEMLVVLEEQRKPLERMLNANPQFEKKFTSQLELPVFINDELVTFGQIYAKENGYKIDEMGILALYSRIDMMQREDHAVTVAEVKDIMDQAIDHSQKANVKHLVKRVFGKNVDESERIFLKEQDFNLVL
ncbi:MAG: hypothetical protein RR990_05985 [Lachnospiraceae bacterium]